AAFRCSDIDGEGCRGYAARSGRSLPLARGGFPCPMSPPTILVTGAKGQLGFELVQLLAPLGNVVAAGREMLDLSNPDAIVAVVRRQKPALIVNAGAYTAVDRAESEPLLARAVNARAPGILAEEAKRGAAVLVHFSTDYVFDGKRATPYPED